MTNSHASTSTPSCNRYIGLYQHSDNDLPMQIPNSDDEQIQCDITYSDDELTKQDMQNTDESNTLQETSDSDSKTPKALCNNIKKKWLDMSIFNGKQACYDTTKQYRRYVCL